MTREPLPSETFMDRTLHGDSSTREERQAQFLRLLNQFIQETASISRFKGQMQVLDALDRIKHFACFK